MKTSARMLPWEKRILLALTAGDSPPLLKLQRQLDRCSVATRESSSAGFYTTLIPAKDAPPVGGMSDNFCIRDVQASLDGLKYGAGFILWVQCGLVDCLEGYTYGEPWPERPTLRAIRYVPGPERNMEAVFTIVKR